MTWPVVRLLAGVMAALAIGGAALAAVWVSLEKGDDRTTDHSESQDPGTWCQDWEARLSPIVEERGKRYLDYQLRATQQLPCRSFGGFSVVPYTLSDPVRPLDDRIDRQGSAAEFDADLASDFQTVARFEWSNWCLDPEPVYFIALGGPNAGRGRGNPAVLTDSIPSCEGGGRARFHYVSDPYLPLQELPPSITCMPEDVHFGSTAVRPWEIGRSAGLGVEIWSERPCRAGPSLTVGIEGTPAVVEVALFVDLSTEHLRVPFRWDNWCSDSATFIARVGAAKAEFTTDAVPHCRGAGPVSLSSGWP